VYGATNAYIADNSLENTKYGLYFQSSSGKYRDNVTFAVDTAYTGGTDIGNNY
jgi:hypothetical protein